MTSPVVSMTAVQQLMSTEVKLLLDQLDPLVGVAGSIRSTHEVERIITLMRNANTTTQKCIILNMLTITKAPSTLTKFMIADGWAVLNAWLSETKKSQNIPLLIEILQVLNKLPVTITFLKQGNMGKLVKSLSRHENSTVKTMSGELLEKWMEIFRKGKIVPGKEGSEDGPPSSPIKEKPLSKKKKEKEKPPVEALPPPGPLVPLGSRPKDRLAKRPRDLSLVKTTTAPAEKKTKTTSSPTEEKEEKEKDKNVSKGPMESSSFMNALSSQAAKLKEKRVKKVKSSTVKSSPTQSKPPVDVFSTATTTPPVTPLATTSDQPLSPRGDSTEESESSTRKRRVTFAPSDQLTTIYYFEMDESERVSFNNRSFLDAAQQEKLMEREALKCFERLVEAISWYRPVRLLGAEQLVEPGSESKQKSVQAEREKTVLAQLFLTKSSVPPTPTEPDQESDIMETRATHIPLLEPGAATSSPLLFNPPPVGPPPGMFPPPDTSACPQQHYEPQPHLMTGLPPPHLPPPPHHSPGANGPPEQIIGGEINPPPHVYNPTDMDYQNYGPMNEGQFYQDGGGPPFRGARRGGRGGGRGRFIGQRAMVPPGMSSICKHYITHGCRLGASCKFLHCTPEEMASKMAHKHLETNNNDHHNNSSASPPTNT